MVGETQRALPPRRDVAHAEAARARADALARPGRPAREGLACERRGQRGRLERIAGAQVPQPLHEHLEGRPDLRARGHASERQLRQAIGNALRPRRRAVKPCGDPRQRSRRGGLHDLNQGIDDLPSGPTSSGRLIEQQLQQHCTEGVHFRLLCDPPALDVRGVGVSRSAADLVDGEMTSPRFLDRRGEPEIGDLRGSVAVQQYVLRLDISVKCLRVAVNHVRQAACCIRSSAQALLPWKRLVA
mmetsp:Transcript_11176/g.32204  ORF Transcript_11176/g.32204 Transcript_11176/m.32204 type:complete len:243 (-) Transcript_11176:437-1165(-)